MLEKKQRVDGFDKFLATYKVAEIIQNNKPINSSKFTLKYFTGFKILLNMAINEE